MSRIVSDNSVLENLGLNSTVYCLFEYDLPSAYKDNETISEQYTDEQAKFFRALRNEVTYTLKFKLHAIKNLYSSWFISEDDLDKATEFAGAVREKLIQNGFSERAERIKIISLVTTDEGFKTFEGRKEDFLFEFISEAQRTIEKGIKEKKLTDATFWRTKQTPKIVNILKQALKDRSGKSRYKEILEKLETLNKSLMNYEQIRQSLKTEKREKKSKVSKTRKRKV